MRPKPAGWQAGSPARPRSRSGTSRACDSVFFGTNLFKYIVFNDPNWDYAKYDFANFRRPRRVAASFLNATQSRSQRLQSQGAKVIMWPAGGRRPSPLATIQVTTKR